MADENDVRSKEPSRAEIAFWTSVQASDAADEYRAYLDRFPSGYFADLARSRLSSRPAAAAEAGSAPSYRVLGVTLAIAVPIAALAALVLAYRADPVQSPPPSPPPDDGQSESLPDITERYPPLPEPEERSASPEAPETSMTANARFQPIMSAGQTRGCQLVFDVVRRDGENFQHQIVQLSGSLSLQVGPLGHAVMIKLGVGPAERPDPGAGFTAPAMAYFVNGLRSNRAELVQSSDSDTPGFRLFLYNLGGETGEALAESVRQRRAHLAYEMPGSSLAAPFVVELSDATAASWGECLGTVLRM